MSRFFSSKYDALVPYTPGEQPKSMANIVKLNTNECPFPPSEKAKAYALAHTRELNLYPELLYSELRAKIAELNGAAADNIILGNGSDELLYFATLAFCDERVPMAFPNISYGFYPVYADFALVPYTEIPLRSDFTIAPEDYFGLGKTIFIANPNAPTGMCLTVEQIEQIVRHNPDNVVLIDEAYIDFGGESCIPLIHTYDNLLVVQTFSKSRSMAGARLGFAAGNADLIRDLNAMKFSYNPYNINSMTVAMGLGVLEDEAQTRKNCRIIMENRAYTLHELEKMGFSVLPSSANFIFAASPRIGGKELYLRLKERGVLIRHFNRPEITAYNRITIGTREQMDILLQNIREILEV